MANAPDHAPPAPSSPETAAARPGLAIVSNVPRPDRVHMHVRLADEIPEITLTSYVLRKGDRVRNGRVVEIRATSVVASQTILGFTTTVQLELVDRKGEKHG